MIFSSPPAAKKMNTTSRKKEASKSDQSGKRGAIFLTPAAKPKCPATIISTPKIDFDFMCYHDILESSHPATIMSTNIMITVTMEPPVK
jgi:hypothetical protein